MADVQGRLAAVVGPQHVLSGDDIPDDYGHDEALSVAPQPPAAVVRPADTAEVAAVLAVAAELGLPVTARGSATGLSGACRPVEGGLVVSFERMAAVIDIDLENHVVVVQPGVTLAQLDEALAPHGLMYPVRPGEDSASLGGNIGTNAGGMRAVKYGVTRHHVLGLEAVLPTGEVIRTGGRYSKGSTGYDLTQLIVGSEGTLALVTEAILRVYPRLAHGATLLAPFPTLDDVTAAVPQVVASGLGPLMCEYIDMLTMAAITGSAQLELGLPQQVKDTAQAYLVVQLEGRSAERVEEDAAELGELLTKLAAIDVYVLPSTSARRLVDAREKAFWTAKAAGSDDIVDIVVPRAAISALLTAATAVAAEHGSLVIGCGHAGDGNVHLSVFQPDADARKATLRGLFTAGVQLGGTISGEHGVGREKREYYLELEDPAKVALLRRIKAAFDPGALLNPGVLL